MKGGQKGRIVSKFYFGLEYVFLSVLVSKTNLCSGWKKRLCGLQRKFEQNRPRKRKKVISRISEQTPYIAIFGADNGPKYRHIWCLFRLARNTISPYIARFSLVILRADVFTGMKIGSVILGRQKNVLPKLFIRRK